MVIYIRICCHLGEDALVHGIALLFMIPKSGAPSLLCKGRSVCIPSLHPVSLWVRALGPLSPFHVYAGMGGTLCYTHRSRLVTCGGLFKSSRWTSIVISVSALEPEVTRLLAHTRHSTDPADRVLKEGLLTLWSIALSSIRSFGVRFMQLKICLSK